MTKQSGAVSAALLLICTFPLLAQKKVPAQAIRFQGAPQYAQQELLAAGGFKSGAPLNPGEIRARARQLDDTGLFKEIKFTSDRKTLLFTLTPSSQLFPMHLENLPLTPGKELEAKLHERFPLYRNNLLPASGSMVDGICRALEEMLAAEGAKATVKATLTSGLGPQMVTAVNFTIVSPAVRIGRIQLAGASPAMQAKASLLASGQGGNSFDTENTAVGLQHVFEDLYHDQGYAAVQVDVARADPLIVSDQSIDVSYAVTIKEGGIYKLGTIDLPAGALVTRAEVEKALSKSRSTGRQLDLFVLAVRDAYSAHGYLDCSIAQRPSFNDAAHIVNYSLEIAPGSQYRLGSVKFDGAPDAMAAKLKLAWKMASGETFDESYLSNFAALAQKKDKSLSKWMQTVITTYDFKPDPVTHEVNCTFHFAKAAQGPA